MRLRIANVDRLTGRIERRFKIEICHRKVTDLKTGLLIFQNVAERHVLGRVCIGAEAGVESGDVAILVNVGIAGNIDHEIEVAERAGKIRLPG
jgi:hypothetical protein